jgi:hypothetical protein
MTAEKKGRDRFWCRHARESGHPVIAGVCGESRERGVLDRPPSRTMTAEKKAGIAFGAVMPAEAGIQ